MELEIIWKSTGAVLHSCKDMSLMMATTMAVETDRDKITIGSFFGD